MTRIETLERSSVLARSRPPESREIREGLASFYYDLTRQHLRAALRSTADGCRFSHLVMGFDDPFMPGWTFPPAIQDIERWNGFSDTDVCSIAHRNAESLYPALVGRMQQF